MNFQSAPSLELEPEPDFEPIVKSVETKAVSKTRVAPEPSKPLVWGKGKVSEEELLALTHQMASTLSSGLSFSATMEVLLLPGVHKPGAQQLLRDMASKVNDGQPLSSALAARPDVFNELYISLVEAGEISAKLPEVLQRLATFQERKMRLRQSIVGSLVYPLFVLLFGLGIGTGMLVYGAPIVEDMYRTAGAELPLISGLFISIGRFIGKSSGVILVVMLVSIPILRVLWTRPSVRRFWDRGLLTWRITSDLVQKATTARCARTLSVLYRNGIPILKAFELTGRSSGNLIYEELFQETARQVQDGSNVSLPLMLSPYFPAMAAGMLAAGEESGNLSDMLDHVADHYESQVEFAVQAMVKFLEPVLIIIVGGFVGLIVVALGIPFMNLMSVLS